MNAPLMRQTTTLEPPSNAHNSALEMIAMIERAATNPEVDVSKFKRLTAIWERAEARMAEGAFNAAMANAQAQVHSVKPNKSNTQTNSRYATYAALDLMLRPIYIDNGFSLSFSTAQSDAPDKVRVLCYVAHSQGHTRLYQADVPADGKGPKGGEVMTKTHAFGSGVTYGKRYLVGMIFNLAFTTAEDDDDGNAASTVADGEVANPIYDKIGLSQSKEELMKLRAEIEAAKVMPHTRRNLIASFNKKLREHKGAK